MCKELKPYTEFHINKALPDGYAGRCKICSSIVAKKYREKNLRGKSALELSEDPKSKIPAEEILTALGYELYNEDNPVWKQFNERMATRYNER